jgi:hypothetical protein
MNLVRGVALIGVAGACCGTGPAPDLVNTLAEKSGGRIAIAGLPGGWSSVPAPAKFAPFVLPKPARIAPPDHGAMLIPTQFSARAELIPTQWPPASAILCDQPTAHP